MVHIMTSYIMWRHKGASQVWKVYSEAETHSAGRSHANYDDLYRLYV